MSRLADLLRERGIAWPAPIEELESLASTNDHLKQAARIGAPAWSVARADRQSAGRGRQGRSWASPAGNLHLSVLLRPRWPHERSGLLPLAAGIAVAEAVAGFGVGALLKWPNDVMASERKLAGVLAEGLSGASGLDAVVIGVGVNVAAVPEELPAEQRVQATSLAAEGAGTADPCLVAAAVLARLPVWYDALDRGDAAAVVARWRALAVPWWGRPIEVRSGGELLQGDAVGVDERGALLVDLPGRGVTAVLSGEARELRLR